MATGTSSSTDVTILGTLLQDGSQALKLDTKESISLSDTISSFARTQIFRDFAKDHPSPQGYNILTNGNELVITTLTPSAYYDTFDISEQPPTLDATVSRVKASATPLMAKFSKKTAAKSPQILLKEYRVSGLVNEQYFCYANSAYQILRNTAPTLLQGLRDPSTPGRYSALKDSYDNPGGLLLVSAIQDAFQLEPDTFPMDRGNDASEVLNAFISHANGDFRTQRVRIAHCVKETDSTPIDLITDIPAAENLLSLPLVGDRSPVINVESAIHRTLSTREQAPVHLRASKAYRLGEDEQFAASPKQLFLKVGRFDTQRKDSRLLDVPPVLDLGRCRVMAEGVESRPLYLKGFTVHHSQETHPSLPVSQSGGHYTACFRKQHPETLAWQWFLADDSYVKPISEEEALRLSSQASDLYYDDKKPDSLSISVDFQVKATDPFVDSGFEEKA